MLLTEALPGTADVPGDAQLFILTIGDKNLFQRSRTVGAHMGLRPRKSQSGDGDPQLRITKSGDSFVRRLLVGSANYILGPFGTGQKEVAPGTERTFLAPLPVGRLWGVGPKTEAVLAELGLRTIGQIADADPDWLNRHVSGGRDLWQLACAIDPRKVVPDREAKSIGAEDTFDEDLAGKESLLPTIHAQALRVARRLRHAGRKTSVVQLKLKLADFTLLTRRTTLPEPTDDGQALYRAASALLEVEPLRQKVRLTGVSAQSLLSHSGQLSLFDFDRRVGRLNAALDRIHDKFGTTSVTTADLHETPIKDRE